MRRAATFVAVVLAFLAGCIAARVAIPSVRAGTTPQRWEYLCDLAQGFSQARNVQEAANKAGGEGWELAAGIGQVYCFKRPLP